MYLNLHTIGDQCFIKISALVYMERLKNLDKRMSNSTKQGMAPGSRRNFKMHINTYIAFCTYYGLELFPADVLQERRALQYLSEFHKCVDSSKSYMGGMHALHEMFGFKPPPADDYLYQLTASGIRRDKGHVVLQAVPMMPELLATISRFVDVEDGTQFACWLAILSGFYLLLRKSNLVPDSCCSFDPLKHEGLLYRSGVLGEKHSVS